MKSHQRRIHSPQLMGICGWLCTFPTVGLSAAETQSAQAAGETQLEEIVVTASKTGEVSLQETPLSITAIAGEELKRSGVRSIEDVVALAPNLTTSRNQEFGQVYIRGVGTNLVFPGSDSSVTVHLDGVYLGRPGLLFADFVELERVEVLRGPQGTLYGRNSVGGTINLIPKAPTDELRGALHATYGNYDQIRLTGSVSGPINVGETRFALSGLYSEREGYVDNVDPTGQDLSDEDTYGVRGAVSFFPSDVVEIRLSADYMHKGGTGPTYKQTGLNVLGDPSAGLPNLPRPTIPSDFRTVSIPTGSPPFRVHQSLESNYWGYAAHVTADISEALQLTSITAYRGFDMDIEFDSDASDVDERLSFIPEDQEQISQELQLNGRIGALEFVTGLYYFYEEDSTNDVEIDLPGVGALLFGSTGFDSTIDATVETDAYAAFAQGRYDLTDRLSFTVGARYNHERKEIDQRTALRIDGNVLGAGPTVFVDDSSWSELTPKFDLTYKFSEDVFGYVSVTEGFKSGGYNFSVAQSSFDPEELVAYELGLKSTWLDGRLRANFSGFYYDYTGLQVQQFVQTMGAARVEITNAADATVTGSELEISALLTPNLRINAWLAYLDATYDDFITQRTGAPNVDLDVSGNYLTAAPEWSTNLTGEYTWQVTDLGTVSLRLEYRWIDDQFFTPFNDPNAKQESYDLINARLGVMSPTGRWEFAVFGRNLNDEDYTTSIQDISNTGVARSITDPRTYGITVSYRFN